AALPLEELPGVVDVLAVVDADALLALGQRLPVDVLLVFLEATELFGVACYVVVSPVLIPEQPDYRVLQTAGLVLIDEVCHELSVPPDAQLAAVRLQPALLEGSVMCHHAPDAQLGNLLQAAGPPDQHVVPVHVAET